MNLRNRFGLKLINTLTLINTLLVGISFIWTISASAMPPAYGDVQQASKSVENQNFNPLVDTSDYIVACGDYQRINQSDMLQRLSKNWQRCYAYTSATISAMRDMERTTPLKQFCIPKNVSTEYAIEVTVKYANKVPETKEEVPAKIVLEALAVRYPC
ncbi:Rap1a/Tai family immunity protein [Parendozoicomonas sp. Alg238-R29]|uniref:Rap1a/Tai family immunity protein n=1 Tax=Parendozoicomonas sp. Alg238-R29 TaxID=2993446 RepID=UPI00248E06F6|nr:Rap1a/Tai family immunity protein [Parendozoicomonas sp. Alg238-R29]